MADITFPTSSSPGMRQQEGGGRLVNCFAEKLGAGARHPYIIYRVPGLLRYAKSEDQSHTRGFLYTASTLLVVMDGRAMKVVSAGGSTTVTDLGALVGTTPVTIARNNKSPTPDIVAVTSEGAFNLFTGSAPTSFADADLPQPNSVCFLDGYFFFTIADGNCYASGINAVTINALDFYKAEARPDGLLRAIPYMGRLFLFGGSSIEIMSGNPPNDTGFPFNREHVMPRGLAGQWAVAGWEEGWSNTLIWVGDDNVVYQLNGYSPQAISTNDVVRSITAETDKSQLEAMVYMHSGHACWAISGTVFTWVYDLSTQEWHERKSYQETRWRGSQAVKAFDQWLVGDRETGLIFKVDENTHTEGDEPLIFIARSTQAEAFPARFTVPRADFDFTVAVGYVDGQHPQINPRASIRWSDDGGYSWSSPLLRQMGPQGKSHQRITILRTGLTGPQGRQWEVSVSDAVHVGLTGGRMATPQRTE